MFGDSWLIVNLYVAVDLAIALFALAVGSYAAFKAYRIEGTEKTVSGDQRYELEKDFYLVSTVGWMTFGARVVAIPLFYATVLSLIPSIQGAMCEFGVFQAGYPFSWMDFGLKLFTIFAFGGWLFFDLLNRKLRNSPFMGHLSRWFILLMPLLFVDALLDIAFFATLKPLVVPCCMVVYSPTSLLTGCPFCLVTYKMPALMGVIATYAGAVALLVWSFLFKKSSRGMNLKEDISPVLSKTMLVCVALAVIGTVLLVGQVALSLMAPG